MKRNILVFALLVPFVFFGCTPQTKNPVPDKQEYDVKTGQTVDNPIDSSNRNTLEQQCKTVGAKECYNLASKYYKSGDFKTAINVYDIGCSMYQYLPSCLKMGEMFEKGEGIKIDRAVALDIYERACYSGHKPSCQSVKRLK